MFWVIGYIVMGWIFACFASYQEAYLNEKNGTKYDVDWVIKTFLMWPIYTLLMPISVAAALAKVRAKRKRKELENES